MGICRRVDIDALGVELSRELERVHEVAVVSQSDTAAVATGHERRLSVLEFAGRTRGRVTSVTDREVSCETVQHLLIEDLVDEAQVRVHEETFAVAHSDPGRLLAPMLEGIEAEVGKLRHVLAGGIHAENAARFARVVQRGTHARVLSIDEVSADPGSV
jgi:hypothetical protein